MVWDGRIVDAKSMAAILFVDRFVRGDHSGNGPTGPADVRRRVFPAKIKRPLGVTMRGVGCLKLDYFAFNRSGTERAMLKTQGLRIAQSSRVALRHNGTQ